MYDMMHGIGSLKMKKHNLTYNGQFKEGDRHGFGKLLDGTGKSVVKSGKWFLGKFKRAEKEKDKKEMEDVQKKIKAMKIKKSKI